MNTFTEKFKTLSEREQKLVLLSGAVLLIAMFYFAVWSPLTSGVEQARAQRQSQLELLSWVEQNAAKAQQLKRSGVAGAQFSGSLAQAVTQSAARFDIPVSRMQPVNDELQVWVDQAPFNAVLAWLNQLEERGIAILQVDISETDMPGQIKIRRLQLGVS
ncbi:type II secretion system protein GspM [Salinimonas chungwhensis]|uniref:type II secretion system protein GspM n=1 Tax=Salinimonas chungwhensis TaxID=265425 RepID=UPI0003783FBF|nr:type II secretion system protein M [Salinimonas chungwhensis]